MRLVLAATAAAVLAAPAFAQPDPVPKDGKVTIPMTLSPAAEAKPAFRFMLQPQYRELQPGERVLGFLKCFMEQDSFFRAAEAEKRQKWLELPLADLPLDEIKKHGVLDGLAYDPPYARFMVFMDQAARYTRVEWNEWFNFRHDGYHALLPEVQKFRHLAAVLKLRMRAEVKAGEFARAVETAKTIFGMARTLEQHPTLIGNLVGIAVAFHAVGVLEELVQQPGCPNLYWGLTDLGSPLMDLRYGAQGEQMFITEQFRTLLKARGPVPEAELNDILTQIDAMLKDTAPLGERPDRITPRMRIAAHAADAKRVDADRQFLVETGVPAAAVKTFTPLQVALTAEFRRYEVARDEHLKLYALRYAEAVPLVRAAEAEVLKRKSLDVVAPALVPAVGKVLGAQARIEQRVAYLRVIEAIRLYAREHDGKLPATLADLTLPVPADPVSGKPFDYKVGDGVATLTGANPVAGSPATNRVYEIRLRK